MSRLQRPPRGLQQRDEAERKRKEDNKTQYVRKLSGTIVHGERLFGRFIAEAPNAPGVMGVLDVSSTSPSIDAEHGWTSSNAPRLHAGHEPVVSRTEASNHQASRSNPSMDTSNPRRSLSAVHRPTLQHDSLACARTHPQGHHPYHMEPLRDQDNAPEGPLPEMHLMQPSALGHQLTQHAPHILLSTRGDHREVLTYDPFYGARHIPLPAAEQRLPSINVDNATFSQQSSLGLALDLSGGTDFHSALNDPPSADCHPVPRSIESSCQRDTAMAAIGPVQQASFPTQLNSIRAPLAITISDPGQIFAIHSMSALLPSLPTRISMDDRRSPTCNSQYGANLVALPRIPRTWDLTPSVTHDPILRPSNPLATQLFQPALSSIRAIPGDYGEIRVRDHLYGSRPIPLSEAERPMDDHVEEALPHTGESMAMLPSLTWSTTSISAPMHPTLLPTRAQAKSGASCQDTPVVRGLDNSPQSTPRIQIIYMTGLRKPLLP
ncbi:hypothetical protein IEO21_08303 [Rhodonia placenta]|uniref:Uncharacterized protein n=1 Tax=Rhodonia placenta TaxID=104341 RepID=A0A8H7NWJ2_9APHY|nr:hypothetical protein IEO21_08303 [Postia placenta]